jgi:hypothetical protein
VAFFGVAFFGVAFFGVAFFGVAFFGAAFFGFLLDDLDVARLAFAEGLPPDLAFAAVFFVTVPAPLLDADLARAIATSRPGTSGNPMGPEVGRPS